MSSRAPSPISPGALTAALADRISQLSTPALVTVDGATASDVHRLGAALADTLRSAGRAALHIEDRSYWRDASIRLEYGHEDVESYLDWVDGAAMRREVVDPLRGGRAVLPSLRDPVTNRSTRATPVDAEVVIISGAVLLRLALDADLAIYLAMSPAALARRTPQDLAWTLAAFAQYESESAPLDRSDVVVRCDDPQHPAVLGLR